MKERPIIMSGENVLAILGGRKTQTRRVMKPQPPEWAKYPLLDADCNLLFFADKPGEWGGDQRSFPEKPIKPPYGKPGDHIWLRETWRPWSWWEGEPVYVEYKADMKHAPADNTSTLVYGKLDDVADWETRVLIGVDEELKAKGFIPDDEGYYHLGDGSPLRWHSPIYMPRWASRILLEITNVRVEHAHDITMTDVVSEGVPLLGEIPDIRISFALYWDSLYAKRGHPWSNNDLVWVYEFKVLEPAHA
jgi:hypothetical protein